jgi:cytochrome b subunit of formate dehydrogenase
VPGATAYVRFVHFHRLAHTFLFVSFLGLALTGLPLKYSEHQWAKTLAFCLGGFESTSVWHRVFALVTFGCFTVYIVRMARVLWVGRRNGTPWRQVIFGPDSPVPNWRDAKDLGRMALWFFGLGPKPTFERWSYWEKFDFWGAIADIVIIGATGLVLWFPNLFCLVLPGNALNIAQVIHSTQALLATGFVFAIHFFSTHFRAEKFPADLSVLTGLVSEEEFLEERPEYFERLRREGRLEQLQAPVPARWHLWPFMLGGLLALAAGLSLLFAMIAAGLEH